MRLYQALAHDQLEHIKAIMDQFNGHHRKDKRLYEITCCGFDLELFQRNTNTNIYCIREHSFSGVQDIQRAKTALSRSFGQKVIEFR